MEEDLEHPENLHGYHKNYSLAPEKIKIEEEMLSSLQLKIKKNDIKIGGVNKLSPNLMKKKELRCSL